MSARGIRGYETEIDENRTCEEEIEADDCGNGGGRYEETWEESHYMILCVCKTYSDEKRENGKRLCGHCPPPPPRVASGVPLCFRFLLFFHLSFHFHFPPLPLFSIPYPVLTAQPRKMPPKASTADQPTTTPKQGTFCLKAPVTLNRVFTAQKTNCRSRISQAC